MKLELFEHLGERNRSRFQNLDFGKGQFIDWGKSFALSVADPSGYGGNSYHLEIKNERVGWAKMFTSESDLSNQFILLYFYDGTYAEISTKYGKTKSGRWRYYSKFFWMGELIGYIDDVQPFSVMQQSIGYPLRIYDTASNHCASIGRTTAKFGIGQDSFTWRQRGIEPLDFEVGSCKSRRVFPKGFQQVFDQRVFLMVNCLFRMAIIRDLDFAT